MMHRSRKEDQELTCPDYACVSEMSKKKGKQEGPNCIYCGLALIPEDDLIALETIPKKAGWFGGEKEVPTRQADEKEHQAYLRKEHSAAFNNTRSYTTIFPSAVQTALAQHNASQDPLMITHSELKPRGEIKAAYLKSPAYVRSLQLPVAIPGASSEVRLARLQTRMQYAQLSEVPGLQQKSNRIAKEMTLRKAIADTSTQIQDLFDQQFNQPQPSRHVNEQAVFLRKQKDELLQGQLAFLRGQQEKLFAALSALQKPSVGFQGLPDEMAAAPVFAQESAAAGAGFQGFE